MKSFTLAVLCSIPLSGAFGAIKIIDHNIQPLGEYEKREVPFLVSSSGDQAMLPLEILYYGKVFNAKKTIAAINFKGTTDYDGVDLLIQSGDKVYVFQNIWLYVSLDVEQSKVVPKFPWDKRLQLEVKAIHGKRLICRFRGENTKAPLFIERSFSILVDIKNGVIRLKVGFIPQKTQRQK